MMTLLHLIDTYEKDIQNVKYEYLELAQSNKNNGIGAPENNKFTNLFLRNNSTRILEASSTLRNIQQEMFKIDDVKQRYDIIREMYCIQTSFHELWFIQRHYNLFYEPRVGALRHRWGLNSMLTSLQRGTLAPRIKGISGILLKWVVLLENLYSGTNHSKLFDYTSVSEKRMVANIHALLKNPNPTIQEVIEDLPLIFEIMHTLLEKTSDYPLDPKVALKESKFLLYAPCAINEGPIFFKKSKKTRIEIFNTINLLKSEEIRGVLLNHFEMPVPDPYYSIPDILNAQRIHETALDNHKKQKNPSNSSVSVKTAPKKNKYRSQFIAIIQNYESLIRKDFHLNQTTSGTNYVVKPDMLPPGINFEFTDFGENICIELIVRLSKLPSFEPLLYRLSNSPFKDLPNPELIRQTSQNTEVYLRLRFSYNEITEPKVIANAMNSLIDQTYQCLISESKKISPDIN